jgi:hypothetical protein
MTNNGGAVAITYNRVAGFFEGLDSVTLTKWRAAYPDVDVDGTIARLAVWLEHNRRSYRNWGRFLTNNLNREQAQCGESRRREKSADKHIRQDVAVMANDRDVAAKERQQMQKEIRALPESEQQLLYERTLQKFPGLRRAGKKSMTVRMTMYHILKNNGTDAEGKTA